MLDTGALEASRTLRGFYLWSGGQAAAVLTSMQGQQHWSHKSKALFKVLATGNRKH